MRDLRDNPHAWRFEADAHCSVTAAIAGSSLIGSIVSGNASQQAASDQSQAALQAAQLMHQQYLQTRSDLLPYNTAGQAADKAIGKMADFKFAPTMAQLEQTPGYQFTLQQGLKATQNSAAARGLGVSGAALKGAAGYATGLASNTYQQQFDNALATYGTNLQRQQFLAGLGESAASQTGNYGTQTAANMGQALIGGANAQAAGLIGQANALQGGLNGLASAYLYGGGGGGGMFSSLFGNNSGYVNGQVDPALY